MTILIVGATVATGSKLVEQLLPQEHNIKIVVRSTGKLPKHWKNAANLEIITANITEIPQNELTKIVSDCDAVPLV